MMSRGIRACWLALALGAVVASGVARAQDEPRTPPELRPYRCVFRINTDISAGTVSAERIADEAEKAGEDVLVFSDQFLARAEWGVPGFRHVIKRSRERPSVQAYGPESYLARLQKVQESHPRLVIIPGLDVAPYYYWTGSPFRHDLTVHQWSEQLTVIGMESPDVIRRMPVTANPHGLKRWKPSSAAKLLLPALLVLLGLWMRRWKAVDYRDEQGDHVVVRDPRFRWLGVVVSAAGVVLLAAGYPYAEPVAQDQYHPTDGPEPFQAYLDWLARQPGTLAFWSSPEIKSSAVIEGVTLSTRPYLSHVEETHGATGFAGIYGDARTACEPGGMWDRTLVQHCRGERPAPLLVVGESDYHGVGELDWVETVLLLPGLSRGAVLEAMKRGRMYARARGDNGRMELLDFSVSRPGGPRNGFFEPLRSAGGEVQVHVALAFVAARKEKDAARVRLISDGAVVADESFDLDPEQDRQVWEKTLTIARKNPAGPSYYRLNAACSHRGEIIANPIFVLAGEAAR